MINLRFVSKRQLVHAAAINYTAGRGAISTAGRAATTATVNSINSSTKPNSYPSIAIPLDLAYPPQSIPRRIFEAVTKAPEESKSSPPKILQTKQKLVILGAGWSAVSLLKSINANHYDITVISPRNYFLFTPLLPSATTGTLESRSLVEPIRRICLSKSAVYYEANAFDIAPELNELYCADAADPQNQFTLRYDKLVVAVGAKNNTFNVPGVEEFAYFLKEINHAHGIRKRILQNIERAILPSTTPTERERLLHFVVVGGGPTGVEFAAELADFLKSDVLKQYPGLEEFHGLTRVTLLQAAEAILNTYDEKISKYAERHFAKQKIHVITNAVVKKVKQNSVIYEDKNKTEQEVACGLTVWSTGIDTVELVKQLIAKLGPKQYNKRALITDNCLRVLGSPNSSNSCSLRNIYALGDCATVEIPRLNAQKLFAQFAFTADKQLNRDQFSEFSRQISAQWPALQPALKYPNRLYDSLLVEGKTTLSLEDFELGMKLLQRNLKQLPATAQVAAQQGEYLAKCLNSLGKQHAKQLHNSPHSPEISSELENSLISSFNFRSYGTMAYLGNEHAAIDLGKGKYFAGVATFWLWKSIYLSKQVSGRTRLALAFDWFKSRVFGRDTSQY
jgi:NADH dehydrogenase FAD-containing subunit